MDNSSQKFGEAVGLWDKVRNIFRISYTLNFVFAALTGVVYAWTMVPEWTIGLLILLDVFLLALFVNISNDYFDHRSGADKDRWEKIDKLRTQQEKGFNEKFFWSGNAFDRGIVTDRTGKIIIASLAIAAIIVALPILQYGGWLVLLMGGIAFFVSFFYTAPPLNMGARGLGEINVFLSFFMMSLFPYVVLVQDINLEMTIIALTVGIAIMLVRVVDQLFGYDAHLAAGEKDFAVRFGREGSVRIVIYLLAVMYALNVCLVLLYDLTYLITLITIPVVFRMYRGFNQVDDEYRWVRQVPNMLKIGIGQELLVVVALGIASLIAIL